MMEDYIQFSAKSKNEAITKACIELGVSSDQLEIQVVTEGSTGFFGIGSKPAIIKVRKIETASEEKEIEEIVDSVKIESIKEEKKLENIKPAVKETTVKTVKEKEKPVKNSPAKEKSLKEKPVKEKNQEKTQPKEKPVKDKVQKEKPVKVSKPIEILKDPEEIAMVENRAKVFLEDVFDSMKLGEVEITSKYNSTDGCLDVDFEGEDMGILIGKRGQTLDSLQYLTSLVVNKGMANYIRVKLDTEDYRRRRKETLESLARGIAYKVKKTRKSVVLEPMNPYERRIIHSALQGNKFVETVSEGEEPYRHVVVKYKRY